MKNRRLAAIAAVLGVALVAATIKIGFITSYSGLNGNLGPYMERGMRLYLKEHQKELPPGVNIEFLIRDDTGPNPDKAKQLAQELIVRDKVNLLAGVIFTPNAMAIAPLATEAKVPFIIMNAGTAVITTRSPYIARLSFTLWQSCYPLGQWAAKKFKRVYTLVSDFGPGHDCEDAIVRATRESGGEVAGAVRVPLVNPDFVPYMQRVIRRPRARQVRGEADRTRRRHHRRGAGEHGRGGARRAHRAPLLGRGDAPGEPGLRRGMEA